MDSGTLLLHYRVAELIGKGGMGEVYRAHDTKLDREVALKILPPQFASDQDRMARFGREAKLLASLHHPNIASIFGFETTDEQTFLVMELVEGMDLSDALRDRPLPVDEAVDVARQIAEGLEDAHEKGIVHRDLKPANIKLTSDGKVKILDFGLARVFSDNPAAEGDVSSSPTMTAAMTQVGAVLGTAAYMSPEQARGKEVDRRADIWAFGVILYEMLTGRNIFIGDTISDTLAGILKTEPEWDELPKGVPFQVERVLRRCLAKDPRQRLRDIGEARVRLEDPNAVSGLFSSSITPITDSGHPNQYSRILPWALLAACLGVLGWFQLGPGKQSGDGTQYLAVPSPPDVYFHISGSFPGLPNISPDGNQVAFSGVSQEDNSVQLYVRNLASPESVLLSDTQDAQYPFWSPDSRWVAYYSRNDGLLKIPVGGGPPQMVGTASNGKGGSWNQNEQILFTKDYNTSIFMVSAAGGQDQQITDLETDEGFNSHRHPQFLPDGQYFLYFARGQGKVVSEIRYANLDGSPAQVVTNSPMMGYHASGHLLFVSHGDLVAQPFDPGSGQLSGTPIPLVEDVMTVPGAAKAAFSASTNGKLVFLQGDTTDEATLSWRDRQGKEIEQVSDLAAYDMVTLSPDGRSAAVGVIDIQAGTWDIWVVDLNRNFRTRFTIDPADDMDLVWGHDSRGIYFVSDRGTETAAYYKAIGSPEEPRLIFKTGQNFRLWDISDDGNTIFYSVPGETTVWDLWCADLTGQTEPRLLKKTAEQDAICQLSPDENWLAFGTEASGTWQVFVAPWPAMSPATQVSTTSGTWCKWTKGGAELIFKEINGTLTAVSMTPDGDLMQVGHPEQLFDSNAPVLENIYWDVTADGERFFTVNTQVDAAPPFCNLVLDWPDILQQP